MLALRARPSTKAAKSKVVTTVTSARKPEVPPTTSTSTSTRTTPSVPVSAGITIAATPLVVPESTLTTRVESPLAAKSQPETKSQYTMASTSKAPPPEAAKGPLTQPPSSQSTIAVFKLAATSHSWRFGKKPPRRMRKSPSLPMRSSLRWEPSR